MTLLKLKKIIKMLLYIENSKKKHYIPSNMDCSWGMHSGAYYTIYWNDKKNLKLLKEIMLFFKIKISKETENSFKFGYPQSTYNRFAFKLARYSRFVDYDKDFIIKLHDIIFKSKINPINAFIIFHYKYDFVYYRNDMDIINKDCLPTTFDNIDELINKIINKKHINDSFIAKDKNHYSTKYDILNHIKKQKDYEECEKFIKNEFVSEDFTKNKREKREAFIWEDKLYSMGVTSV